MTPRQIGATDYQRNRTRAQNPYRLAGPSRAAWFGGWDDARRIDFHDAFADLLEAVSGR